MTVGASPGWYPDPENPAHLRHWDGSRWAAPPPMPKESAVGRVFFHTLGYAFGTAVLTALAGGTAAVPVIGTWVALWIGFAVGLPLGFSVAGVLSAAARDEVSTAGYRKTLDSTLAVLGVATVAVAVGFGFWAAEPAVGIRCGVAMVITAGLCMWFARNRLQRLVTG